MAENEPAAEVTRELMVHVERVVRPIAASVVRKMRMRRELLAHLTEAFAEERAGGAEERDAVEAAKRRLGDVEELRQELRAGVPWYERLEGVYAKGIDDPKYPRMFGGRWRATGWWRWAGTALWVAMALLPATAWVVPAPQGLRSTGVRAVADPAARELIALAIIALEVAVVAHYQFVVEMLGMARPTRAWRALAIAALGIATSVLMVRLPALAITGRGSGPPVADMVKGAGTIMALVAGWAWVIRRLLTPAREWLALEIDG